VQLLAYCIYTVQQCPIVAPLWCRSNLNTHTPLQIPYSTSLWQQTTISNSPLWPPQGQCIFRRPPSPPSTYDLTVSGTHRWANDEWINVKHTSMYLQLSFPCVYTVLLTSVLRKQPVALCKPLKAAGNLQPCSFYRVYTANQDFKSPAITHPLIPERCMSCHVLK
jgi:hypothetical protein